MPNPYFSNAVLTKTYRYGPAPSDPTQEPALLAIKSSPVVWKVGRDLTLAPASGEARRKPAASFFCLFQNGVLQSVSVVALRLKSCRIGLIKYPEGWAVSETLRMHRFLSVSSEGLYL